MKTSSAPQSVLITGAQGALGIQVVKRFLAAGCRVTGIDRIPPKKLDLPNTENLSWIEMDITNPSEVRAKVPTDIDAMIHCAGGFRWVPTDSFQDEDLDFLLNTNLKSSFLLARQVLPGMKKRNFGRIVFIGAKATLQPSAGMGLYTASKAGLNMLTGALADEVREFDINVNTVMPSIIDTAANRADMPQADFSKWVSPVELAEIIFSLTQPLTKTMNGALIPVAGRL
jgi:NAD(P)-dependent dehydrogenase (short-subunit alcohol dehydrogenase family)